MMTIVSFARKQLLGSACRAAQLANVTRDRLPSLAVRSQATVIPSGARQPTLQPVLQPASLNEFQKKTLHVLSLSVKEKSKENRWNSVHTITNGFQRAKAEDARSTYSTILTCQHRIVGSES